MKYIILLVLMLTVIMNTIAQDKYADFNGKKKSLTLNTGIRMKYIDTGNPNGEPVLLLHGYTDASRSFQLMIEELTKINKNLRIIAPDMRGHGESSMPDPGLCKSSPERCFSMELFVADIIDLMNQLKIQKASVAGHSMGSSIAQTLALQHPDRINNMILIGTFVNGKNNAVIHDFLIGEMVGKNMKSILEKRPGFSWPSDAYALTPGDLGPETAALIKEYWVAEISADQKFVDAVYPETMKTPLGTWIGVITVIGNIDNREAIKAIKTPTLIIWATQDPIFTKVDQEEVKLAFRSAAKLHGTRVIYKVYGKSTLPEAGAPFNEIGHNVQWAAPAAVAGDISAFLRSGKPVAALPYANPRNAKEILIDNTSNNIEVIK